MGLFGLFYMTFRLGCKGAMGIKNSLEDSENRTKYRDDETNTYLDHNMTRRDLRTNHRMSVERSYKGDMWLRDCETGHYVRNLSDERAEQKYQIEKAKADRGASDRTHIRFGNNDHHCDSVRGYRYKDFKTGKMYVARSMVLTKEECNMIGEYYSLKNYNYLKKVFALIDIDEKKAVRLTDKSIEYLLYRRQTDEEIKEFSDKFLKRFNEYINEPYSYFKLSESDGIESGNQDSFHEGNFIVDIRAEMDYKYGKRQEIKLCAHTKPINIEGNCICIKTYTNAQGITCNNGDVVVCDEKGLIKNANGKCIGNINTYLREYFERKISE